jgi:hypothetical protein
MQYSNNMLLHNNLLQASGLLLQLELLQPRLYQPTISRIQATAAICKNERCLEHGCETLQQRACLLLEHLGCRIVVGRRGSRNVVRVASPVGGEKQASW